MSPHPLRQPSVGGRTPVFVILGVGLPCKIYRMCSRITQTGPKGSGYSTLWPVLSMIVVVIVVVGERNGEHAREEDDSSADRRPEGGKRGERARREYNSSADRLRRRQSLVRSSWSLSSSERKGKKASKEDDSSTDRREEGRASEKRRQELDRRTERTQVWHQK